MFLYVSILHESTLQFLWSIGWPASEQAISGHRTSVCVRHIVFDLHMYYTEHKKRKRNIKKKRKREEREQKMSYSSYIVKSPLTSFVERRKEKNLFR